MRSNRLVGAFALACAVLGTLAGTVSPARAAPLRFGALMLRATDLGPGYYESGAGYTRDRSGILQPGFPLPGEPQALKRHGFVAEFSTMIWSRQVVHNTTVTSIRSGGDQFTTAAGAHWAFTWTQSHAREAGLYLRRIPLPGTVGAESYGIIPMDGDPGRGVVFRQGRYLVQIVLFHHPPQLTRLFSFARLVARRVTTKG